MKPKRVNKTKEQLIEEQRLIQEADRKRAIIKDKIYPLLKDLNETIKFIKIFVNTANTAVSLAVDKKKEEIKISDLRSKLDGMFNQKDKAFDKYRELFDLLKDESVISFQQMLREFPDNIERFYFFKTEKLPFTDVNIDEILG